nr:AraC family transcriptional regulator [uncultured Desulfobacter sp.]
MNQKAFPSKSSPNSTENQISPIPAAIGQGSMETVYSNSGIRMIVSDYKLHEPATVKIDYTESCYGFGFCLSGSIKADLPCFKNTIHIQRGQSGFFNFPKLEPYSTNIHSERVIRVLIFIKPDLISQFAETDAQQLPSILLTDGKSAPSRCVDTITPPMRAALHQIFNCTYQGISKQLYIEGKALELIAHKIEQMSSYPKGTMRKKKLTPDEIERVRHAATLLALDLENPPNVTELSSKVGMCRSKLFVCFQEVFGVPPFGYLHQRRMEMAEYLLKSGEINVTQAACAVGYSSLSHFTKAFKRHFGVLPGKCFETISICS